MRRYIGKTNTISGNSYEVEIWEEPGVSTRQYVARVEADGGIVEGLDCLNTALGSKDLPMAGQGFVLDYEGEGNKLWENPIMQSRIQAQFAVSDTEDHTFFQTLAVGNEGDCAIVVYKNSELFYVGRIIPDGMQYERRPEKNSVYTITAVDGLALLDKFKVEYDWFDSATERISILELVRQSLAKTSIPDYYEALGREGNYLVDASQDFPTGDFDRLNKLEINMSSAIGDLTSFMDQNTLEPDENLFIDSKEAIERLLRMVYSRMIYTNSRYYIYDPIDYAEKAQTISVEYGTDGTQTGKISTLPQYLIGNDSRPCFEAFPILTHQPAVREIKQTFTRQAINRLIRPFNLQAASAMTLSTPTIGYVAGEERELIVKAILKFYSIASTTPPPQQYAEINFRIYVDDPSFGYRYYDYQNQTWTGFQSTIPAYERVRCEVIDYQKKGSQIAQFTLDFVRNFIPPAGGENVVIDISLGKLSWNWTTGTTRGLLNLHGCLYMYEKDSAPMTVRNYLDPALLLNPTESYDFQTVYGYEFTLNSLKGIGTIWNADTSTPSNITASTWATRQLACYVEAPKVASATLVDDGDYYPILTPQFDSESYTFNGGTFNAQSETWDFEILKITQDVAAIQSDELDFVDTAGGDGQQNDAIGRIIQETSLLRDSVSNFDTSLPTDIMRLSPDTPTTQPTIDTYFNPVIVYDATDEVLEWNVQEMGKVQSLTGGTHNLDVSAELIVCDTTAENVIVTLPSASLVKGRKYIFKKISSSHNVQLSGTIDSAPSYSFNSLWESITIMSDGSEYYAVGRYHS